jgi:hypothetical protein
MTRAAASQRPVNQQKGKQAASNPCRSMNQGIVIRKATLTMVLSATC